ncbi:MAG TPA: MFS transporter [Chloroflexia bacterium]|nr:MFS transporter [Chloroflexia bacterium]
MSTNTVLAFLVLGLGGAWIGPALPWLAHHWGVRPAECGILFALLFGGACGTVGLSGLLLDRVGRKPVLVAGLLLEAIGIGGLGLAPSLGVAMAWTLCLGLGAGCLDVTLNVVVADLYPLQRGAALNLMNVAFGVGALASPLLVGAALSLFASPQGVGLVLSSLALLSALIYAGLAFPARGAAAAPAPRTGLGVLREGYVITLALMLFLYVGLEAGFGGWATTFAIQGAQMDAGAAALVTAVFWIALTGGRIGAGLLSRRVPGSALVLGGALLGAAGVGTVAGFSTLPAALFLGAVLAGAGFAPIFPTALGLAAERYPATVGTVSSAAVLGGALGGALLPYSQGLLLGQGGVPLAAGFMTATALGMIGLQLALGRSFSPHPATPPASPCPG